MFNEVNFQDWKQQECDKCGITGFEDTNFNACPDILDNIFLEYYSCYPTNLIIVTCGYTSGCTLPNLRILGCQSYLNG